MNPKVEKLTIALKDAKETINTLKADLRTLKAAHKEELKAAKGGVTAKPAKIKKAVKAKAVKKGTKKPAAKKVIKKVSKKPATKKAPRARKTSVSSSTTEV